MITIFLLATYPLRIQVYLLFKQQVKTYFLRPA